MVLLNRYGKYWTSWNYRLHTGLGFSILLVSFFYGFFAMKRLGWAIKITEWHNMSGIVVLIFASIVAYKGKKARERMLSMQRNHREMI